MTTLLVSALIVPTLLGYACLWVRVAIGQPVPSNAFPPYAR